MKPRCVYRKHCQGCNLFNLQVPHLSKKTPKNNTSKCHSPPPSRLAFIYLFTCCFFYYYFTVRILSLQPRFPTGYPAVKKFPILVSLPRCTSERVSGSWVKAEEMLAVSCICVFLICVFSRYLRGGVTPPGCVSRTSARTPYGPVRRSLFVLSLWSRPPRRLKEKREKNQLKLRPGSLSPPLISTEIRFIKRISGSFL